MTSLIVNMAGPDRPGLVEALSSAISSASGNWEGSRMAKLSGQFAGVVHVVVPDDQADLLRANLQAMASDGLLISISDDSGQAASEVTGESVMLDVVGLDRTGIVSEISHVLTELGVNVEELLTECLSAPMSGERLFEASAIIVLPDGITEEQVQNRVEEIDQDLQVTISDLED